MGTTADEAPGPVPDQELDPPERFLAVAAKAEPGGSFRPTPIHEKLAEHLFTSQATSFLQLAEESGVSRTTIWRTLQDPQACQWICSKATDAVKFGLGAVHSRLLQMALTSRSPAFLKLYMERFDPEYAKQLASGGTTINQQFNMIKEMSQAELEAFVKVKKRREGIDTREEPSRAGA